MQLDDIKARQRATLDTRIAERRRAMGGRDLPGPSRWRDPRRPVVTGFQGRLAWPRSVEAELPEADEDELYGACAWRLVEAIALIVAGLVVAGAVGWWLA